VNVSKAVPKGKALLFLFSAKAQIAEGFVELLHFIQCLSENKKKKDKPKQII